MARVRRKLKITPSVSSNNEAKIHFDFNDNLFADDHYNYYLMCSLGKNSTLKNPRKYFYFKYKKEYYTTKNDQGFIHFTNKPVKSKSCILDDRLHHEKLILQLINKVFTEIKSEKLTQGLLIAIGIVIDILELNNIILNDITEFKTEYQIIVYNHINNNLAFKNQDKRDIRRLFSELEKAVENFEFIQPKKYGLILTKSEEQKELTSSVMFQLEYYALQELNFTKSKVEKNLHIFNNQSKILCIKNLLYTLFSNDNFNQNVKKSIFTRIIIHKLLIDYDIDASILFEKGYEKQVSNLKVLSRGGVDLSKDEIFIIAFIKELYPYYPNTININEKYKNIVNNETFNRFVNKKYGLSLKEIESYLYPNKNAIYALYLLLMIRTGLNSETLLGWEVYKKDKLYHLNCDNLGILSVIESEKNRSNAKISCVLKNDSDEMKFINFYINWATNIYDNSKSNCLFQYFNRGGLTNKKIETLSPRILNYFKDAHDTFFQKYEIYDERNIRLNFIDHRSIRKGHNFQEYLKGKKEFERQLKKKHLDSKTTKIHYEDNSKEWSGLKKHKIAKSQNLLVSIFKGEISRKENKTVNLFNGSMSNCKNNKYPTFKNAPKLKDNEFCLDWTKCLTQCEQAYVIPKVHGPVIFAWIDFMKNQQDEFINEEHWEKEYLHDYNAAINTISYFTEEEKKFCDNEMYKHKDFVKIVLKRSVKVKRLKNA